MPTVTEVDSHDLEQPLNSAIDSSRDDLSSTLPISACSNKLKYGGMFVIAISNGILYGFTIPLAGGNNVKNLLGINGEVINLGIYILCIGAGACYTMFCYKTLERVELAPKSLSQIFFLSLSPFAACGYLTGGVVGSQLSFLSSASFEIGSFLYAFRLLSCIDASIKFPDRIYEMKQSFQNAWHENDKKELARLFVTAFFSVGYALASTDAIFAASQIVLKWIDMPQVAADDLSYGFSILGAIGILPLTLYWTHRGLRQLTYGGKVNTQGENLDPTDKNTYYGALLVLPNILGVIGAAISESPKMIGRAGVFADVLRISSSMVYALACGTPGMATFVRTIRDNVSFCKTQRQTVSKYGLEEPGLDYEMQSETSQRRYSFFCCKKVKLQNQQSQIKQVQHKSCTIL